MNPTDIISNIKSIRNNIKKELAKNPSMDWSPLFDELATEEENLIGCIEHKTGFTVPPEYRKMIIEKTIKKGGI